MLKSFVKLSLIVPKMFAGLAFANYVYKYTKSPNYLPFVMARSPIVLGKWAFKVVKRFQQEAVPYIEGLFR